MWRFGEGLELSEQLWIVSEINAFLESTGKDLDYQSFPINEGGALSLQGLDTYYTSSALTPLLFMEESSFGMKDEVDEGSEGGADGGND